MRTHTTDNTKWENTIEKALENADFVVIVLSPNSVSKRGFAQREIKRSLEAEEEMLEDDIFLIPVQLEPCTIPSALHRFQVLQAHSNRENTDIVTAISEGCKRRGLSLPDEEYLEEKEESPAKPKFDLSELGGGGFLAKIGLGPKNNG